MIKIHQFIEEAILDDVLWEFMDWDLKHGPTEEEEKAFRILFPDSFHLLNQ